MTNENMNYAVCCSNYCKAFKSGQTNENDSVRISFVKGDVINYEFLNDGDVHLYMANVDINLSREMFDKSFRPLPSPPSGYLYVSLQLIEAESVQDVMYVNLASGETMPVSAKNGMESLLADYLPGEQLEDYGIKWVLAISKDYMEL